MNHDPIQKNNNNKQVFGRKRINKQFEFIVQTSKQLSEENFSFGRRGKR